MRKTLKIRDLIDMVNTCNRLSVWPSAMRQGQNVLLEKVLHDANVYAGFGYYEAKDLVLGELPGIIRDTTGGNSHMFPDESRRFYYLSQKL